ncbi:NAD(+) diphosphatase [Cuneatibacter caecimuris]|uniref:NAD(+) diphosphatase n=1 Tax=Cuneatibacter caecimuris TaxID=1796618 RepID=A0A4Q7PMM6_9FIRM|nr:NAD(+) diphosphatase [Cuneatibacter caecimuris]RZT02003.1 NAD+ diphosphatase [Cuneatibacter caecimuris]
MIQDIGEHIYDNAYRKSEPSEDSFVLWYQEREVLVRRSGEMISFPVFGQLVQNNQRLKEQLTYLFSIDGREYFLAGDLELPPGEGYCMVSQETLRMAEPRYLAFAGITGLQLNRWYGQHRFCGCCGRELEQDAKERMLKCPSCGQMEYPKISPAVIVGVTDGDRLLLTKYVGRTYKKHALVAGFAEIGESIEDTVRREVREEVGLELGDLHYYKSQPWSFSDTLLLGFFAELKGSDEICLQEDELAVGEWFSREDIVPDDDTSSLTNEMIRMFREGKLPW